MSVFTALDPQIKACLDPGKSLQFRVVVQFGAFGTADAVRLEDAAGLSSAQSACVERTLRRAKIPALHGSSAYVRKTYAFGAPR